MILANTLLGINVFIQSGDFVTRPFDHKNEVGVVGRHMMDKPLLLAAGKATFGIVLPELGARFCESKGKKTHAKILRILPIIFGGYGMYTNIKGAIK